MDPTPKNIAIAGLVIYGIAVTFMFVLSICDSRTQYSENKVIIEQLCDIKPTSYWCHRERK